MSDIFLENGTLFLNLARQILRLCAWFWYWVHGMSGVVKYWGFTICAQVCFRGRCFVGVTFALFAWGDWFCTQMVLLRLFIVAAFVICLSYCTTYTLVSYLCIVDIVLRVLRLDHKGLQKNAVCHLKKTRNDITAFQTVAGKFLANQKCHVKMTLAEFNPTAEITHTVHVAKELGN